MTNTQHSTKVYDEPILVTIKKILGIDKDYTHFDKDILVAVNAALFNLSSLFNYSNPDFFNLETGEETWESYLSEEAYKRFPVIPQYIALRSRLLFDPPTNSFLIEGIERQLSRFEFLITVRDDELERGKNT